MKNIVSCWIAWYFFTLFFFSLPLYAKDLDSLFINSLRFAKKQLLKTVAEVGDTAKFPRSTMENGKWKTKPSGNWTSGFFPGSLWYMYEWTSDKTWRSRAERWTASLEREKNNTGTHDVGFMIFCSFGNGYRLTGNENYKEVILQAAQSLATRFNPSVGCIKSWDFMGENKFPVIIDNMMNLEILFWAAKNGGKKEWYDMAVSHALKTMRDHVRDDGSTYQVVLYDAATGEVQRKQTRQGYTDESTWARGQAWGLYGFTMTYRETGDGRFLKTAKKLADYFIDHLPADHVPYWDFNAPSIPDEERDASAGAIASSGLLELSALVSEQKLKKKYRNTALNILKSLSSPGYLAKGTDSSGILLHGVGFKQRGKEVDVSLIYADYYFIEALLRALKNLD